MSSSILLSDIQLLILKNKKTIINENNNNNLIISNLLNQNEDIYQSISIQTIAKLFKEGTTIITLTFKPYIKSISLNELNINSNLINNILIVDNYLYKALKNTKLLYEYASINYNYYINNINYYENNINYYENDNNQIQLGFINTYYENTLEKPDLCIKLIKNFKNETCFNNLMFEKMLLIIPKIIELFKNIFSDEEEYNKSSNTFKQIMFGKILIKIGFSAIDKLYNNALFLEIIDLDEKNKINIEFIKIFYNMVFKVGSLFYSEYEYFNDEFNFSITWNDIIYIIDKYNTTNNIDLKEDKKYIKLALGKIYINTILFPANINSFTITSDNVINKNENISLISNKTCINNEKLYAEYEFLEKLNNINSLKLKIINYNYDYVINKQLYKYEYLFKNNIDNKYNYILSVIEQKPLTIDDIQKNYINNKYNINYIDFYSNSIVNELLSDEFNFTLK
jgi:hypothetical protein